MNRAITRTETERLAALMAEKRRRLQKQEHSTRGYRDDDGVWQGGLLSFVRDFWHILEPGTPFVDGWVLHGIAEHLEAISFGEITNLLINVPPGFSKSLISNCFWPAWEWGPMHMEHLRYVTFSYSSSNTERDNQRFGDLISCPEYQAMYPHVKIRQKGMTMVSNMEHGWKLASSVSGSVTGKRGNRAICFPGDQMVATERGAIPIGAIVEGRMDVPVWSYNRTEGRLELKLITAWHKNPGRPLLKLSLEDGRSVTCTEDHPILTSDGYRKASDLRIGQFLACSGLCDRRQAQMPPGSAVPDVIDRASPNPKLGSQRGGASIWPAHDVTNVSLGKLRQFVSMQGAVSPSTSIIGLQRQVEVTPDTPIANASDSAGAHAKLRTKLSGQPMGLSHDLPNHFLGEMRCAVAECPMSLAIGNVLSARSVFEVVPTWVASVSVLVTDFLAFGARANKGSRNQCMSHHVMGFAVASERDAGVSFNDCPSHDLAGNEHVLAGPENAPGKTPDTSHVGHFVELKPNDLAPYLACITSIDRLHDIPSVTYCLTVQGNHNLICGSDASVICSNCDDLNNVSEAESKTILDQTNRWFRESLSSRLNNMETDAKVVIAQRTSEGDVSGEILTAGLPYCHYCVPMEYVWQADEDGNPYTTEIGWVDPRWRPDAEDCEGELAWPERFPAKVVQSLKREIGEFATAAQMQQTPAPRGGGILKREYWLPAEQYMTDGKFPPLEYIVASLDGAFDVKEENDPSALTVWGVFQNEVGYNRAMLIHAWAKKLPISGPKMEPEPGEHESMYKLRTRKHWGLVELVADTCNRFKVDRLLIENKASGKPAAQSLQNSHGRAGWEIVLVEPRGDKYARGLAVQPSFSQGMIYAPDREWAQDVIDQCAVFPRGRHDDLYDSTTQALKHLRDAGLLRSDEDRRAEELEAVRHKGAPKPARYPGFRSLQR